MQVLPAIPFPCICAEKCSHFSTHPTVRFQYIGESWFILNHIPLFVHVLLFWQFDIWSCYDQPLIQYEIPCLCVAIFLPPFLLYLSMMKTPGSLSETWWLVWTILGFVLSVEMQVMCLSWCWPLPWDARKISSVCTSPATFPSAINKCCESLNCSLFSQFVSWVVSFNAIT